MNEIQVGREQRGGTEIERYSGSKPCFENPEEDSAHDKTRKVETR